MTDKRLLIALVLLVLAVVAVAGCTGTGTPSATPATGVSTPVNNTAQQGSSTPGGVPPGGFQNGTMPGGAPPGDMTNGTAPGGTPQGGFQNGTMPGGAQPGGSSSSSVTLSGSYTVDGKTATEANGAYTSSTADVSAVYVANGGNLTLTDPTVTKAGDTSSADNSNFYGLNAGVVAASGSSLAINGGTVTTGADGANAIFSTGTGTTVHVSDVTIRTSKDSSRGLDVTMGGTIIATNLSITTQGAHCAPIAADRGGGTLIVSGGTMSSAGEGSPVLYCTANFTVTGITGKATGSEAAVIEGKNSITLVDSSISGAVKHGVMIYQSTSGDASVGTGEFTMTGGSLAAAAGPLFYVTNTEAVIKLYHVAMSGASGILLAANADSWGTSGSNGGIVSFLADGQTLAGDITADSISSISLTLQNGTTLTGAINSAGTAKAVTLSLDSTSLWVVTGTSYLSALDDDVTDLSNIVDNGHTIYYDASLSANSWLGGKTYTLADGGKLTPKA